MHGCRRFHTHIARADLQRIFTKPITNIYNLKRHLTRVIQHKASTLSAPPLNQSIILYLLSRDLYLLVQLGTKEIKLALQRMSFFLSGHPKSPLLACAAGNVVFSSDHLECPFPGYRTFFIIQSHQFCDVRWGTTSFKFALTLRSLDSFEHRCGLIGFFLLAVMPFSELPPSRFENLNLLFQISAQVHWNELILPILQSKAFKLPYFANLPDFSFAKWILPPKFSNPYSTTLF